ncbi:MAG TPA: hypothetical protein VF796_05370 [Humisphaera sp.]
MSFGVSFRCLASAAAVAVVSAAAPAAFAGITLVSQERGIGVDAHIGGDPRPAPLTKSATGLGLFDETANAAVFDEADGDRAEASASQRSRVTTTSLGASGRLRVNENSEYSGARSLFRVAFDVATSQRYALRYSVTTNPDYNGASAPIGFVSLRHVSPSGGYIAGPDAVGVGSLFLPEENVSNNLDASQSGVLTPGRYEFVIDLDGGPSTTRTRTNITYDAALTFAGGSTPPSAVPLPPAAWGGLGTLGLLAGGMAWRRRRRAAADAA